MIGDKGIPLGIGDQPVGEREGLDQHAVRQALLVEGEARFLVPDAGDPAGVFVPTGVCPGAVTREQRVLTGKLPRKHHTRQLLARLPYAAWACPSASRVPAASFSISATRKASSSDCSALRRGSQWV